MALTDIIAPAQIAITFPRLPAGLLRLTGGTLLAVLAYMLWIVPNGLDAPMLMLVKLWLSIVMLSVGLGLCLDVRRRRD